MSVGATIQDEINIQEYIKQMVPGDEPGSECHRQPKPSEGEREDEEPSWKNKPLEDMYHRQIQEGADTERSHQWLV